MSGTESSLKTGPKMPISMNGMSPLSRISRILGLAILLACPGIAEAAKKKAKIAIAIVTPELKKEQTNTK